MERHVLVVFAHPDDETFATGGTIALFRAAGVPVTYVCATRGEMGRRMGKPLFANRETLGDLRERELRAACKELGITDLHLLGIWDKTVEFVDPDALTAKVGAIIAAVRPSLVITFHPEYGGHPDHSAIGAATVRAVAALPPEQRPTVRCPLHPRIADRLGIAVAVIDITAVAAVKQAAVGAHRSQSEGMDAQMLARPETAERWRRMYTEEYAITYRDFPA